MAQGHTNMLRVILKFTCNQLGFSLGADINDLAIHGGQFSGYMVLLLNLAIYFCEWAIRTQIQMLKRS